MHVWLVIRRADVHMRATFAPSAYFIHSCQSPRFSLTHFKEDPLTPSPIPLKVPFSLVLMADRLWPHSLTTAACPHCVPLSERSVWVEDRLALQSECLTWMYGLGVYPLTESSYHPPATPSCHMHPLSEGEREGERDTGWEYLWHSDACLTLEEANHRIEVLRMIGLQAFRSGRERGREGALNANPFLIKIGSI